MAKKLFRIPLAVVALVTGCFAQTSSQSRNQRLIELQSQIDARLTKMADDPRETAEMRADEIATKAKIDALFTIDRWLGTDEASAFINEELARQRSTLTSSLPQVRLPLRTESG